MAHTIRPVKPALRELRHLYPLKSLRNLNLQGTQVTPAGVEALRRELPDCQIVH